MTYTTFIWPIYGPYVGQWFSTIFNIPGPTKGPYMADMCPWTHKGSIYGPRVIYTAYVWPIYGPYVANMLVSNASLCKENLTCWNQNWPLWQGRRDLYPTARSPAPPQNLQKYKQIKKTFSINDFQWSSMIFNDVPLSWMIFIDFQWLSIPLDP